MAEIPYTRHVQRAELLAREYPFAAQILHFYIHLARFQHGLHSQVACRLPAQLSLRLDSALPDDSALPQKFCELLLLAETKGPLHLADLARALGDRGSKSWAELWNACWQTGNTPPRRQGSQEPADPQQLLVLAFLQPLAELARSRVSAHRGEHASCLCPFCHRKPVLGILRQMGDGGLRSLLCSFCGAEWEFRRIVCPACGEEDNHKLPVYTAEQFSYIRVECCDRCKTYLKTIDLTKNGLADPVVDEIASAPLDLWAQEHGYTKLQVNLLGM